MAARTPAGSTGKERRVILARDVNMAVGGLLLEMAAQTKRGVARDQHPGVHGTVRIVAYGAAFAYRFVLKNERSELRRVALGAGFVLGHKFRAAAHDHGTLVWTMAIAATYLALKNRVMRRQMKFSLFVQVTLKTCLRRFARIDDGIEGAAGFIVKASGTMTGFATDVLGVIAGCLQMIMGRGFKVAIDVLMTLFARLRANIGRSGDLWRCYFHPIQTGAGNHSHSHQ